MTELQRTGIDGLDRLVGGIPRGSGNRLMDFIFSPAHNISRFRIREAGGKLRRELRIEKMEGAAHSLDWLPFEITSKGIVLQV